MPGSEEKSNVRYAISDRVMDDVVLSVGMKKDRLDFLLDVLQCRFDSIKNAEFRECGEVSGLVVYETEPNFINEILYEDTVSDLEIGVVLMCHEKQSEVLGFDVSPAFVHAK